MTRQEDIEIKAVIDHLLLEYGIVARKTRVQSGESPKYPIVVVENGRTNYELDPIRTARIDINIWGYSSDWSLLQEIRDTLVGDRSVLGGSGLDYRTINTDDVNITLYIRQDDEMPEENEQLKRIQIELYARLRR